MPNVSLTTPTYNDYGIESASIERRRRLAEALQAKSLEQSPTEMAGGWAIPQSPFQHIGKLAQALAAGKGQEKADTEQRALGAKYQADLADTLNTAQKAGAGTPAIAPITPNDDEGNAMPGVAATPPDKQAMIRALMGHPGTQAIGMGAMQKEIEAQQRKQMLADALNLQTGPNTPAPGTGQGGAFKGLPPQIVALMTSGDPELMAVGKAMLEASKGIAQRPGAPVVNGMTGDIIAQAPPILPAGVGLNMGPNGPQAYNVPGALPAMAAATQTQAGASAAGALPFHPPTVVNTPGAPTLMTPQQQIEAATGQPIPQPGAGVPGVAPPGRPAPAIPARPAASTPPASNPTGREASRAAILQGELETEMQQPQTPQRDQNIAQLRSELGKIQRTPGLPLQDQGESAQQQHYGAERGKLLAEQPQAQRHLTATNIYTDNAVTLVKDLLNDKGLTNITGPLAGRTPNFTGTATNAQAKLNALKSQLSVTKLSAMREESKTGGAVGAVTEKEWPRLEAQFGAIEQAQTTDEFKAGLNTVRDTLEAMRKNAEKAYSDTYGRRKSDKSNANGWTIKQL